MATQATRQAPAQQRLGQARAYSSGVALLLFRFNSRMSVCRAACVGSIAKARIAKGPKVQGVKRRAPRQVDRCLLARGYGSKAKDKAPGGRRRWRALLFLFYPHPHRPEIARAADSIWSSLETVSAHPDRIRA